MATMVGPDLKMERAQKHLCELDAEIRKHDKTKSIMAHDDLQAAQYVVHFTIPDPDIRLGPMAGDFLNNVRSALDHLAWQLSSITYGENVPKTVHFPIIGSDTAEADRPNKIADATSGIPDDAVAVVKSFQPYTAGTLYKSTHLWRLHRLWNIDKHRHTVFHATALDVFFPGVPAGTAVIKEMLDDGGIVRFPLSVKPHLKLKPVVTPRIFFGSAVDRIALDIQDFFDIYNFVRDKVLPPFERFFPKPEKVR